MTTEQQRIAIAEFCGTLGGWYCPKCRQEVSLFELQPRGEHTFHLHCDIPIHRDSQNYPNDLNAMHEAEKKVPLDKRDKYFEWLCRLCEKQHRMAPVGQWLVPTASSTIRAEALLRTIGKWVE